jgi:hypothetical protein
MTIIVIKAVNPIGLDWGEEKAREILKGSPFFNQFWYSLVIQ